MKLLENIQSSIGRTIAIEKQKKKEDRDDLDIKVVSRNERAPILSPNG